MSYAQPSYSNVFVPQFTEQLIVDYSRNPKDFLVNMLLSITPVDKPQGSWLRIKPDAQARVKGRESVMWIDGAPRPVHLDNMSEHEFVPYFTQRSARTAPIGYDIERNAVWDIKAQVVNNLANKLMLDRAIKYYQLLADSNNYLANHSQTALAWNDSVSNGGAWSASTNTSRFIQRALMAAQRQIIKSTVNANISTSDLFFLMGPVLADKLARSPEIADYIKESTDAAKYIEFKLWADQNARYGLPQTLYGVNVVVDETIKDEVLIGETSNKSFLPADSTAFLVTKKGGVKGSVVSTSFGSVHAFVDKNWEMKTETFDEPVNARTLLSVSDSWDMQLVGQAVTCAFTSIT